jgi:hypothetical protein
MTNPLRGDIDQLAGADTGTRARETPATGGAEDRGLHAPGQICARCQGLFTFDTWVRRTVKGGLVHDRCPEGVDAVLP